LAKRKDHKGAYESWYAMKGRVLNPNNPYYPKYKDREICPEWMEFDNFLRDMGDRPEGCTLDRKDNSKGYTKDNCRWATRKEQARNTSTYNGVADLADQLGIKRQLIHDGLRGRGSMKHLHIG